MNHNAYFSAETGGVFRLAVKLMMSCASSHADVYVTLISARSRMSNDNFVSRDFVPLVNLIGVFFQIRDDYCNLQSTEVSLRRFTHIDPARDLRAILL